MPRTYAQLKSDVLILTDNEGATDIGSVVEIALLEAMKYVASMVRLDSLTGEVQYTTDATDVTNLYISFSDFNITDMVEPLELYISESATAYGDRYEYRRYLDWRRSYTQSRGPTPLYRDSTRSTLPVGTFTIDPSDRIKVDPFPSASRVVTLIYQKDIAAYSDAGTPEIPSRWDSILVSGAMLWVENFLKQEKEDPITPQLLFKQLDPQIDELKITLESPRTTPQLRVHRSYKA